MNSNRINNLYQFNDKLMELVIHFNSITNSNKISNIFQFNYKLQSGLRIMSSWITKVIRNFDYWPQ